MNKADRAAQTGKCCVFVLCCCALLGVLVVVGALVGVFGGSSQCFPPQLLNVTLVNTTGVDGGDLAFTCTGTIGAISTPNGDGLVEIVSLTSDNVYTQQQLIPPPDTNASAMFGESLSLTCDGSLLAVGEPGFDSNSGRLHVYALIGDMYEFVQTIDNPNSPNSDLFADSISLSCIGLPRVMLIIGAPLYDNGDGRVYAYGYNGSVFLQETVIEYFDATNATAQSLFGAAVSSSCNGNSFAIGAPRDGVGGAVSVFNRANDGDVYSFGQRIEENNQTLAHFGQSVSMADRGTYLAVGAERFDTVNETIIDAGAVSVFIRSSSAEPYTLYAPIIEGAISNARFGHDVGLSHKARRLVVGASDGETATHYLYDFGTNTYLASTSAFLTTANETMTGTVAISRSSRAYGSTIEGSVNSTALGVVECDVDGSGTTCPGC